MAHGYQLVNNNTSITVGAVNYTAIDGTVGQALITNGAGLAAFGNIPTGSVVLPSTQIAVGNVSNLMSSSANLVFASGNLGVTGTETVSGHAAFGGVALNIVDGIANSTAIITAAETTTDATKNHFGTSSVLTLSPSAAYNTSKVAAGSYASISIPGSVGLTDFSTARVTGLQGIASYAGTFTGNSDFALRGLSFATSNDGVGTLNQGIGATNGVLNTSTGTIGAATGIYSNIDNTGGGLITTANTIQTQLTNTGGSSIVSAAGLSIEAPIISGGSTITNNYGVKIGDQTGTGISFGLNILSQGLTSINNFEGTLKMGVNGSGTEWTLLNTRGTANQVLTTNGSGATSWTSPSTVATALPINGLTNATGTNTLANAAHTQVWNWDTITNGVALTLGYAGSSMTTNANGFFKVITNGTLGFGGGTTIAGNFTNSNTSGGQKNIGLLVVAGNAGGGTANALRLQDGSQGIGKVLTDQDGSGTALWQDPTASLSSLTAATASNTINNLNFGQVWNWSTFATGNAFEMNFNGLTTGTGIALGSTSLTSGNGLTMLINGTGALTNQTGINVLLTGANGSAGQTTYGGQFTNSHTGSGTNIGLYASAGGGANNYALKLVDGTEGTNKVLTSDASGNASWATPTTTASGTYTPTAANNTNLDSNPVPSVAQWMQVGQTVTVSGEVTAVDPTTTLTTTSFTLSLPVASNFATTTQAGGTAVCGAIAAQCAAINADVTNDVAQITWKAADVTSQTWSYTYTYKVT